MNIVIIILSTIILIVGCSTKDNVKISKVGKTGYTNPYGLHKSIFDIEESKENKHPYLLSSNPKRQITKSPYNMHNKNMFDEQNKLLSFQLGTKPDIPFWNKPYTKQEKKRIFPYIVRTDYIPDPEHDYLKIFKLYKKPKIKAFLLGNANYQEEGLLYTINDVYLFASFLEKALAVPRQNIIIKENLKLHQFIKSFTDFSKTIEKDELVIIYYSGHSRNNGTPIFTDMKAISGNDFQIVLNATKNDTILIMDSSYLSSSELTGNEDLYYKVDSIVEESSMRPNILRIYSNLVHRYNKEGRYKNHFILGKHFKKAYAFVNDMDVESEINTSTSINKGNGIFTLLLMSFFADFSYIKPPIETVSYETIFSYINNILSQIEEEIGEASDFLLARPTRSPILNIQFKNENNNYILLKTVYKDKENYDNESLVLRSLYNKAIQLQDKKQYKLATNLFLNVLALGGNYRNTRNLLSSSYLSLADLNANKTPYSSIEFYKYSLRYNPDSSKALYGLSDTYSKVGRVDKAKDLLIKAQEKLKKQPSSTLDLEAINKKLNKLALIKPSPYELLEKGFIAYSNKQFDDAFMLFSKAQKGFRKENNSFYEAICFNNIGSVYLIKEQYTKALNFYSKSLRIKRNTNNLEGIANSYNNIGVVFYKKKNYKKAIYYFKKSLDLFKRLKFTDKIVAKTYINLSNLYLDTKEYEKAYVMQKKAIRILAKIKDFSLLKEKKKLSLIEKKLI